MQQSEDFFCLVRVNYHWTNGDALTFSLHRVETKSQSEVNLSFSSVVKLLEYSLTLTLNYEDKYVQPTILI